MGRNSKNHFINFNGTAGIWRKSCIIDAGGWQSDTLTEDLDLSYRAQLKQWKFEYVEEICSPSELPVEINALKAQQYRWTKGAAECVRKNLPRVIRSKNIPLRTKIHAIFHLMNSSIFVFILLISLLAMPVIIIKPQLAEYIYLYRISGFFMISWFILAGFYWVSFSYDHPDKRKLLVTFLYQFPLFLAISMGLGLHNCIAVIEGWIGRKTPFVRTPKFNINAQNKNWEENKYNVKKLGSLIYFELAMLMYFTFSFITAVNYKDYGLMPMILLLIFGYGIVVFNSIFNFKKTATKFLYKYEV